MFEGVYTAIVTPFDPNTLKIDFDALERLVEQQVEGGVDGIIPCGTTGESATLSDEERVEMFRACIRFAAGRLKVVAGVGTNDTARAIENARGALELGADGGLVVTPYYNKPTQEGLYLHYRAIAEAVPQLPLIPYNVPSRTSVGFAADTLVRLSELPNIVAVKEASADMAMGAELVGRCGSNMLVLSGDDATALPLWSVGGRGVICVASNLVPERMVALWRAFDRGDLGEARRLHLRMLPLFRGLFVETNPTPVKQALAWATGISAAVRLPLAPLQPRSIDALRALCESQEIPLPHLAA